MPDGQSTITDASKGIGAAVFSEMIGVLTGQTITIDGGQGMNH